MCLWYVCLFVARKDRRERRKDKKAKRRASVDLERNARRGANGSGGGAGIVDGHGISAVGDTRNYRNGNPRGDNVGVVYAGGNQSNGDYRGDSGGGANVAAGSRDAGAGDVGATGAAGSAGKPKYGRPEKLGLKVVEFVNVHRRDDTAQIELMQGSVEGLSKLDETDLLIVYLRERGVYKAKRDSSLAALNRTGIKLADLEKESKPVPSYRRHYHCWLSRLIPKPRPLGFEYKRLLVYEDPGEELQRDDNIVLDIVKCLTTVIGGDVQIASVMIPLSGALLSPSLRKHLVKATLEVAYSWIEMGLPLKTVKILLPEDDISKDVEIFKKTKEKLEGRAARKGLDAKYDVFFSYAEAEKEAVAEMMRYLREQQPDIRIFDAQPREISLRKRGVVHEPVMEAINNSRVFLSLLSDDYFKSVECTEAFSLAYCRDFDSQGGFMIPIFWHSCDLTPLARRLIGTEGVDCREASFESAHLLLDEILNAIAGVGGREVIKEVPKSNENESTGENQMSGKREMNLAEKLLMKKDEKDAVAQKKFLQDPIDPEEPPSVPTVSQVFFDRKWRETWATDFKSIIFGPRIGAGGFGEVYKCKCSTQLVAVKTLQHCEEENRQSVMAEFMVEMKLMSKLKHPNIISFIGACVHSPNLCIILEYMPGGSLYRAIHRRRRNGLGPFPHSKSVWIAYGVAKGMAYLHSRYPVVIHRDLKSPNILLGRSIRDIKLIDFGLSRLRVNTYVNTSSGGTAEWMAPELLRTEPFDETSDVFSFGVILWELVMCDKPWRDLHPLQVVLKVGTKGMRLPTPSPEKCLPQIRAMIVSCFAERQRRPKFADIVHDLEVLVRSLKPLPDM